jgi:GNAT superfamily N-acetyltransferase
MAMVAAAGGSPDADTWHLAFVAEQGRLLAAVDGGTVVGFGGVVPAHGSHMVTDLFVDVDHGGRGVGGRLVAALLDGVSSAFTFSSTHPAALAAYRRAGLALGWPLLTMRGVALGGGESPTAHEWGHDRAEVAQLVVAHGGWCTGDALMARRGDSVSVLRLAADRPADAVLASLMSGIDQYTNVVLSVPAHSPALAWLMLHGFRIDDVDIFCSTADVALPDHLWAVHRGLA